MRLVGPWRALAVAAVLVVSSGCQDYGTAATGTVAVINVTVSPNPISATVYSTTGPTYAVNWTVLIVETAGRGGTVQKIESSIYDPTGGELLSFANYDSSDLLAFIGTSRIGPLGQMSVPQQATYVLASGKAALLAVTVSFTDDGGVFSQKGVLVKIQ